MRRSMPSKGFLFFPPVLALCCLCLPGPSSSSEKNVPVLGYRVVASFPHDDEAFTQGLAWDRGDLLEGTGLYGKSRLRRVELETGRVLKEVRLRKEYFGEGIAVVGDRIIQLTWRSQRGFVYDRVSFQRIGSFTLQGEGWGITWDGARLIVSDGTDTLRFLDPGTFAETGKLRVRHGNTPVMKLNELEYIKGLIYANVWGDDLVACISPKTGLVVQWIDLKGILSPRAVGKDEVLNGIAYDPEGDRIFVTGKRWPRLFAIEAAPGAR